MKNKMYKPVGRIILGSKMLSTKSLEDQERKRIFNGALELAASLCEVKLMDGVVANNIRSEAAKRIRALKG